MTNYPSRKAPEYQPEPESRPEPKAVAGLSEVIRKKIESGELDASHGITWGALQKVLD